VAKDAIDFVYKTYLPDRTYRIHGPKTVGGSNWPASALQEIPNYFDPVNFHNYDADISNYTRKVRCWMNGTVRANSLVWVGEWRSYEISYGDLSLALSLIKNLIRGSQPGIIIFTGVTYSVCTTGESQDWRSVCWGMEENGARATMLGGWEFGRCRAVELAFFRSLTVRI
jgi:hypothetical protein